MINTIKNIIRKNNSLLEEDEVTRIAEDYLEKINNEEYNFSLAKKEILTQGKKKRVVYTYANNSLEHVLCGYLKEQLDLHYNIKYPNRNKIMNVLFNTIPVLKDLSDFVIIRYDFKSFFDSVSSEFIFEVYIENSSIPRSDKKIFKRFSETFDYCYAGLNTSNAMTEIACKDFDKFLRASLEPYGVVYCHRYVDDALIILNRYITEKEFRSILNMAIKCVFHNCSIRINESKFYYIARRNIKRVQPFDFLGYNFTIVMTNKKQPINIKFGITEKKQKKYELKIKQSFYDYIQNGNIELLRQRIKAFSSRIVYSNPHNIKPFYWITKGIVSNYNELRYHMDDLDDVTKDFLENIYYKIIDELKLSPPYFFDKKAKESSYNLYSTMKRNRSMIFDKSIGLNVNQLVKQIKRIDPYYVAHKKTYYNITKDYLDRLKIQ